MFCPHLFRVYLTIHGSVRKIDLHLILFVINRGRLHQNQMDFSITQNYLQYPISSKKKNRYKKHKKKILKQITLICYHSAAIFIHPFHFLRVSVYLSLSLSLFLSLSLTLSVSISLSFSATAPPLFLPSVIVTTRYVQINGISK